MALNTAPIYTGKPDVQWTPAAMVTANTSKDLTSGTNYLAFTANATNGGYVDTIRFVSEGTNVATVARIWLNNGSSTGTVANNVQIGQQTLAATTNSEVAALTQYDVVLQRAIPPGYRIYITIGTAVSAGWTAAVFGGDYTPS